MVEEQLIITFIGIALWAAPTAYVSTISLVIVFLSILATAILQLYEQV